jgi:hypothetical protein
MVVEPAPPAWELAPWATELPPWATELPDWAAELPDWAAELPVVSPGALAGVDVGPLALVVPSGALAAATLAGGPTLVCWPAVPVGVAGWAGCA